MIYRNKPSGLIYRWLLSSFNVNRQRHEEVYMHMETGAILNCDTVDFEINFEKIVDDPQDHIVPKVDYDETNDPTDKEWGNETVTSSNN